MKKKRTLLLAGGVLTIFVIIVSVILLINSNKFHSKLPETPNLSSVNDALKEQILTAIEKVKKKPDSKNLGHLAMVYHSSAYYNRAEKCYKLAIEREGKNWRWYYYLAYLYKEMGNSKLAVDNFRKVTEINSEAYHAWYYAGEGFRNLKYNDESETVYRKIENTEFSQDIKLSSSTRVDFFPINIYAKYQLARLYLDTNKPNDAQVLLNEIISSYKSFGPAYRLIGEIYRKKGETGWSNYYITRAGDYLPYSEPVDTLIDHLVKISRSDRFLLKQIDEAEKSVNYEWTPQLVNQALKFLPNNKFVISKAIKIYLKSEYKNEACSIAAKHMEAYENEISELIEVAGLFYDKELYDKALQYYTKANQTNENDYFVKGRLAMCFWMAGEKLKGEELTKEMIKTGGGNTEALENGIRNFISFGNYNLADKYLNELEKVTTNISNVYELKGILAQNRGLEKEAISLYKKSLEINPGKLDNTLNLISLLLKNKAWSETLTYLHTALSNHPNDPEILERTGYLLINSEDRSLRNLNLGKELSERAFYHSYAMPQTMISAGRNLVIAYANSNDLENARYYIKIVKQLANETGISKEYSEELEHLENRLKAAG